MPRFGGRGTMKTACDAHRAERTRALLALSSGVQPAGGHFTAIGGVDAAGCKAKAARAPRVPRAPKAPREPKAPRVKGAGGGQHRGGRLLVPGGESTRPGWQRGRRRRRRRGGLSRSRAQGGSRLGRARPHAPAPPG